MNARKTNKRDVNKNKKTKKQQHNRPKEKSLELSLIRTYPHQVAWEVWLPAQPQKLTTTVTTGLIASVYQIEAVNITSFATRFGSTFVEYRIIRAEFRIRLFSSTFPGVIQFWIDEKSNAVPNVAEAQERATLSISASSTDNAPMMKWVNADPLDLQYIPIATTNTVLSTFKAYTNNSNFGASIVATDYLEILPIFQFQFRGLQGV